MDPRWPAASAAAALLASITAASATTRIDARRLAEIKPGMTSAEVRATLGEPEVVMSGVGPGKIMTYRFVYTQWEPLGLYGDGVGLAGFGPDDRLVRLEVPARKVDPADAQRNAPHGHSNSAEAFARLDAFATDPAWGYGAARPIRVGGLVPKSLPLSESAYLNALRGPGGETVDFERQGACCRFETSDGPGGFGMLDVFRVRVQGHPGEVLLYLDMYDTGPRDIPAGFTYRLADATLRNVALAPAAPASAPPLASTPAHVDRPHCAPPAWPPASREAGETGTVRLDVQVGLDGAPQQVEVRTSSGHPALDEAARVGFRQCRFVPATQDGVPAAGSVVVDYSWKLP